MDLPEHTVYLRPKTSYSVYNSTNARVPVRAMKAYITVTFIILFLTSALNVVRVSSAPWPLVPAPRQGPTAPIKCEATWASEPVRMLHRREKPVAPALNQTTIPRLSSVTCVISLHRPAHLQASKIMFNK